MNIKRYRIDFFLKYVVAGFSLVLFVGSCYLNPEASKKYALIYGISKYIDSYNEGEGPNLTYTDDDARAMAEMLKNKGYNITLRINSDATKANLDADIGDLKQKIKPTDLFLFYYSGHGMQNDSIEYILLYGSIYLSGTTVYGDLSKTYSDTTLGKLLKTIPTNKKVVILDSCNSGGFIGHSIDYDLISSQYGPSSFSTTPPSSLDILLAINLHSQINNYPIKEEAIKLYNNYNPEDSNNISPLNAIVISASGKDESSWEDYQIQHWLMTYFLLDASKTKSADLNGDGYISTLEAFFYCKASIDINWNSKYYSYYKLGYMEPETAMDYIFTPHISGGPVDFILFKAPN